MQFPVLSTVRVVRSIRDLKSTNTARPAASHEVVAASESADKVVNAVVMKAAHHSIEQLPSKAVDDLTDLLSCTRAATDGLLPCQLQDVSLSSHYIWLPDFVRRAETHMHPCVGSSEVN